MQSTPAGGGAQVSVQAEGASQVWLEQGGRSLPCRPGEEGVFTLSPVAPGPCTAVAAGANGRTVRVDFLVGDGDLSSPVLVESWGENGLVALRLQDPSGVDWPTLSLTGEDGTSLSPAGWTGRPEWPGSTPRPGATPSRSATGWATGAAAPSGSSCPVTDNKRGALPRGEGPLSHCQQKTTGPAGNSVPQKALAAGIGQRRAVNGRGTV